MKWSESERRDGRSKSPRGLDSHISMATLQRMCYFLIIRKQSCHEVSLETTLVTVLVNGSQSVNPIHQLCQKGLKEVTQLSRNAPQ